MATFDFFRRIIRTPDAGKTDTPSTPGTTPAATERRRAPRVDAREGLRVLIIDDSATVVATLGRMLRQARYETTGAADAEAGIAQAKAQPPDLIFLDIVLPNMSGFDALRVFRREAATAGVPIIMISGNAAATEQFYVRRIGADDFMKKPFGRAEVFTHLQKMVESGRLPPRLPLPMDVLDEVADDSGELVQPDGVDQGTPDTPA